MKKALYFLFLPSLLLFTAGFAEGMVQAASPAIEYRLGVSFDIPQGKISGRAEVPVRAGQEATFHIGELRIIQATLQGAAVDLVAKPGEVTITPPRDGMLVLSYEGVMRGGETVGDKNYGVVSSTIDERGISLTGAWYPLPGSLAMYRLTAVLPKGYEAVSEAEQISVTPLGEESEFRFEFNHPVDGISLVATNRYEVLRDSVKGIDLLAYFFKEDRELAKTYLRYAKKYLERYEGLLTPYPYKRFMIVENFLPTGYSMPTFTLLGQDVVRLPFIVETSLGHEILHQWFGNSLYIDYDNGNWAEGLTTYLADHLYEEDQGTGWEYRKRMLTDYSAYVSAEQETSLRQFRGRMDRASRAVGYGKSALVFHMLKKAVGEEAFYEALRSLLAERQYRMVSWADIRSAFERLTKKELGSFFAQWIDEKGLPDIRMENAAVRRFGSSFEVTFDLVQRGKVYTLDLPLSVMFLRGGGKKELLAVTKEKEQFRVVLDEEPAKIVIDGDYDTARRITEPELPPVISRLVGDEKPLIILPAENRERYGSVIEAFKKQGVEEREAGAVKDADIKSATAVILGYDNPAIERLFGTLDRPTTGFHLTVRKNPWDAAKVVGIVHAASDEEAGAAVSKIFHYGKYSALSFEKGRNTMKTIAESERGITAELRQEPLAVDLSLMKTLNKVVDAAADKKIIYVGEYHDRHSHHHVQLQVVQSLHQRNRKVAVGMEMFQRPFQKTLDDFIAGTITEREFLKQSEYFKRWGFDYNLYKPILDFAKAEKIPVVALNVAREITEKVSQGGMDALTDEERKAVPAAMDLSDAEYRARLKQVFEQHRSPQERNFDYFVQAQVLWDEMMAESIDRYLSENPDRQMIVAAGGGHLVFGAGIPKRTFRRNGLSYAIILNDAEAVPGIADYVVYPQPLDGLSAPKLNALFKETDGRLQFTDFGKDSVAKQAGVKSGDILIALDGAPVATVEEVKLALFYKKKDDKVKVQVLRKRFLIGETELEFEVTL